VITCNLTPGTVVGTRVGLITHVGIVTDRHAGGQPMVISNSMRSGRVEEEPLRIFQGGFPLVPVTQPALVPASEVLSRARQKLGTRWDLLSWNCEHFVHWAFGQDPKSPQLRAGLISGLAFLMAILARK
jgi:hypothetical protein